MSQKDLLGDLDGHLQYKVGRWAGHPSKLQMESSGLIP